MSLVAQRGVRRFLEVQAMTKAKKVSSVGCRKDMVGSAYRIRTGDLLLEREVS